MQPGRCAEGPSEEVMVVAEPERAREQARGGPREGCSWGGTQRKGEEANFHDISKNPGGVTEGQSQALGPPGSKGEWAAGSTCGVEGPLWRTELHG